MGLDVSYFERVEFVKDSADREYDGYDEGLRRLYPFPDNAELATRADGLASGWYRIEGESGDFLAGSYNGYNRWREQLAKMAHNATPEEIWKDQEAWRGKAFFELIHFADNEGCIGPQTSAKLARDFAEHQERAEAFAKTLPGPLDGKWFIDKYNRWRKAFETARHGGAVMFH